MDFQLFPSESDANSSVSNFGWYSAGLVVILIGILALMGRPFFCPCGTLKLWQGDVFSPQVSQHLTDWYTFTHVIHGILLYGGLWWLLPDKSHGHRFIMALAIEGSWEIFENTEFVIDYYRQNTMAVEFYGDTIINSVSDLGAMAVGYWITFNLPLWGSVGMLVVIEVLLTLIIRDSFFLNVLMFLYPFEFIKSWQLAPLETALLPGLIGRSPP